MNPTQNPTKNRRKKLKKFALEIGLIPLSDLNFFLHELLTSVPEEKKNHIIQFACRYQFEDQGKWLNIEKWMEGCFVNHHDYTPVKVANMCCNYWKIHLNMKPNVVKRAQRVKDRLRKRLAYNNNAS